MPISIKSETIKYKDSNGDYQNLDAFAEAPTAEKIAEIEEAGDTVLASIPSDYTALSNKVDEIDNSLTSLDTDVTDLVNTSVGSFIASPDVQNNNNLTDKTADSGFLTLISGVQYRKHYGIVYVWLNKSISLTTTYTTIATLPSGYRPSHTYYYKLGGSNGSGIVNCLISTTGEIQARVDSGTQSAINGFVAFI